MLQLVQSQARKSVIAALVAGLAAVLAVTSAQPANAVEPTDWLPVKLSFNPQILLEHAGNNTLEAQQLRQALGQRAIDDILGTNLSQAQKTARFHSHAQAAAAKGAYIPGLSDAAKALGRNPQFVTFDEASEWYVKAHGRGSTYTSYASKPGSGGVLSAKKAANGVFDITTLGKENGLKKGAKKMGGAVLKTAGTVMVAGEVLNLTYTLTNGGAQLMGVPGADASSGSITCDLASAITFAEDVACDLGPTQEYTVNEDAAAVSPGWVGDNLGTYTTTYGITVNSHVTVLSAPAWRATTSGQYTARIIVSGGGGKWYETKGTAVARLVPADAAGGALSGQQMNTLSSGDFWPDPESGPASEYTKTATTNPTAARPFDHIDFYRDHAVVGRWYPVGHAKRPIDVAEDPERWWVTEWTCTGGGGGSEASARYRESEETWATPVNPTCRSGQVASVKIWQHTEGLDPVVVFEWAPSPGVTEHNETYPQCSRGECVLDLLTKKTGKLASCFDSPSLCTDWFSEPDKETQYECHYAGSKVSLSSCNVYSTTFDQTKVKVGQPYGDPMTGDPLPKPGDGPTPDPDTGTGPSPSNDCPPAFSWGGLFNPWWYYKGVTCALQDAFVPNATQTQTSMNRMQTAWSKTTVATWSGAISGTFDGSQPDSMACEGPHLVWDFQDRRVLDMFPFSACGEPQKTWASWSRIVLGTAIVFTGGFACVRALGSGFGWKPSAGGDS